MAEQPVNLTTALCLGVFSRAEQRVLQAIFKAIAESDGECVATLATLARDSNTSKSTTRNAIARAVAIGLLEKTERRFHCAVSLPNILIYGKPDKRAAHRLQHQHREEPSAPSTSTDNQTIFGSSNESHGSGYRPQSPISTAFGAASSTERARSPLHLP
jgi:hypothetical protein